jgi:hypothetical protein
VTLTQARFSIEGDPQAPAFDGWHDERARWNGWAVPYFSRETLEAGVLAMLLTLDGCAYRWDGETLEITEDDGDERTRYVSRVEPVTQDGQSLYCLGMGWVWDTITTDDEEQDR